LAYDAGHQQPLLITLDQENGLVNSIFDSDHITQFPSAMAIAASRSPQLAKTVATATAKELSCLGVNMVLGPVLDVHARGQAQQMGVRSLGEDNHVVSELGLEYVKGYHSGGLLSCGKHFPGYGNLMFPGNLSDIPSVPGTLDQLYYSSLAPFQVAVDNEVDSMLVGACAMPDVEYENVLHACLSRHVVTNLLRERLGFKGVVICECLEIESMYESFGVGQASVMAVDAGCDLLMVCNSYSNQREAISAIQAAVVSGVISIDRILESVRRVSDMKRKLLTWDRALNPMGVNGLALLKVEHEALSIEAYENSITLIRDRPKAIPLSTKADSTAKLLLLTPLVETFHGAQSPMSLEDDAILPAKGSHASRSRLQTVGNLDGEAAFQSFGRSLAKMWSGKVVHTSYTASGVSPLHERLVSEAAAVVLLTADGFRNTYQYGFTKYVLTLCKSQSSITNNHKPCVVVAVSSPYDFYNDETVSTYLCTYDCTDEALKCLSRALFGMLTTASLSDASSNLQPVLDSGRTPVQRQLWLVEDFVPSRDLDGLQELLDRTLNSSSDRAEMVEAHFPACCFKSSSYMVDFDPMIQSHHFVVRNSSTRVVYGFCATYYVSSLGLASVGLILVDIEKRQKGIGFSLHQRALSYLRGLRGIKHLQLGTTLPSVYPGIPNRLNSTHVVLRKWVKAKYNFPLKRWCQKESNSFLAEVGYSRIGTGQLCS
jgi:beta-N-acetylhexosaminidase